MVPCDHAESDFFTTNDLAMRTIQHFLPQPRHTEIHRIFVNATPDTAWAAARHFNMAEVPWIKLLFDIRTIPDRIAGHEPASRDYGLGVDQITAEETGFIVLDEVPGQEVVIGSIGKFWHLKIPFLKVTPDQFRDFDTPGYGKIAWAIRVEPFRDGSTITIELRTSATDDNSWKKLSRYYQVIGVGSKLIRTSVMSILETELGKMTLPNDHLRALPGDEIIPGARFGITLHRNIEAPVSLVWRYLMQLGCDRAGWYSIDKIDNGGRQSTDHIIDAWKPRSIGDKLQAAPDDADGFFEVYSLMHEQHMVIGGKTIRAGSPFEMTWAFVLEPVGTDATHLITRARMASAPRWKEWLMGTIAYPPVHALMSKVQLDTIKAYAERDAQMRVEEVHAG